MASRRGFTLVELMLAITLTGIVAVLVYGASGVAVDTETRLSEREVSLRSERAWRAVIEDALRNLRANADYPEPTLVVESGANALGWPTDRLEMITAGGTPPLTPDADWRVTLEATERGVSLTALPIGVRVPARRVVGLPEVTGLSIRVLATDGSAGWLDAWSDRRRLPRAVEVTLMTDTGPAGPPLLVAIPLEFVP